MYIKNKLFNKKKLRIVFIGAAKSSEILLGECLKNKIDVIGVCTKKKSFNTDFVDLKKKFSDTKLIFKYTKKINDPKVYSWIKLIKPDLILCFGWSEILKKKLIKVPAYTIGFHPSELPNNRGRHPIIWSLALNLKKTASSFFIIEDEKVDSGLIISQKKILISRNDNAESLYKKIMFFAKKQIKNIFLEFKKKKIKVLPSSKKTNFWRKRNEADGKIDWRMSALDIDALVRALNNPYPNSHFLIGKDKIKVIKSKIIHKKDNEKIANVEPGKILLKANNYFDVKCGSGVIRILKINKKIKIKNINYL